MSKYTDRAAELFKSGLGCGQAVSGAFADVVADKISYENLISLGSPFGGGFAATRGLCGCVTGMGIIFGLLYGAIDKDGKAQATERIAGIVGQFKERYGALECRDLSVRFGTEVTGTDIKRKSCLDYVEGAAELLEQFLRENGAID